uniref:Tudor domain-containing protein n=1 Tax=Parascaris univalens TaxID=6257 RepID=A0A915BXI2_PARUN
MFAGRVYLIRAEEKYERAWFLKYHPNDAQTIQMMLFDKGIESHVERNAIFSCPIEAAAIDVFGVRCPVLVANATEEVRCVARKLFSHKCRCIPDHAVSDSHMMPYLKGRILIEYESGGYAELKDIALKPIQGRDCAKFIIQCEPDAAGCSQPSLITSAITGESAAPNGSDGFENQNHLKRNNSFSQRPLDGSFHRRGGGRPPNGPRRNAYSTPAFMGNQQGAFLSRSNSIEEHYAVEKQVPPPIHGSIFKEFEPSVYPKLMRVRYDREDGEVPLEQFWVIDPSAFTTVERVLHEGRERYGDLGTMESSNLHHLAGLGCLVRVSVDGGSRCLCRAIIGKYSSRQKRVSVYLVDFGLFKWARGNDLLDLSSLNESDPALAIHVSMFRCRMGPGASMRMQDMMKGSEYEILIVSRDADGIFVVSATLVGGDVPNKSSNTHDTARNVMGTANSMMLPWTGNTIVQTLTNFFGTQVRFDGSAGTNSSTVHPTTASNAPNAGQWSQFGGYLLPCVMPVAVPVPMAVPTNAAVGNPNQADTVQQDGDGDDENGMGHFRQPQNSRAQNGSDSSGQFRNNRFRGGRQWSNTGGSGPRNRSFGSSEEGGQHDSALFDAFGSRGDGLSKGGDFIRESKREGGFWGGGASGERHHDRQFRRGGAMMGASRNDFSAGTNNTFSRVGGEVQNGSASAGFKPFEKGKGSFMKRQTAMVSSEWDIPASRMSTPKVSSVNGTVDDGKKAEVSSQGLALQEAMGQ